MVLCIFYSMRFEWNRLRNLVGDVLFYCNLFSQKSHCESISIEFQSLADMKNFRNKHSSNYNHCQQFPLLSLSNSKGKFQEQSFFARTVSLCNSIPRACFQTDNNMVVFKSKVTKFLLS